MWQEFLKHLRAVRWQETLWSSPALTLNRSQVWNETGKVGSVLWIVWLHSCVRGFRGAVACRHALGHGKLLSRAPRHVFAHSSAGWVFSFLFWFEPGLEDGKFSRDFTFSQHLIRKTGLFWEYFSRLSKMEQKIKRIAKNTSVCYSWSQFVFHCH